ncbi:MAG: hypothetical protein Q7S79_03295 [bacterium]|nr:hypothetical protein [bacterium]
MTPGVETAPVSTTFEVPMKARSSRFCNVADLTRSNNPRYKIRNLDQSQINAICHIANQINQSELHPEVIFENPAISYALESRVEFGNSQASTLLREGQFVELLDAIFGGQVTDKDLPEGIMHAKQILFALEKGQQVVLRFDL